MATFAIAGLSYVSPIFAQSEEKEPKFQATLYGGLYVNNENAWTLEPNFSWQFHKYIGISAGLECTRQYNQPNRSITFNGTKAELTDNEVNVAWIIFKPSVVFYSPDIWHTKDKDKHLWFQAEPGISIGTPFHNSLTYEVKAFNGNIGKTVDYVTFRNKGLRCIYWNARASVNFSIDEFVIGAGYAVSDLDYYSGRRNVTLPDGGKFWVPKKEISQYFFLSLGYKF